MKVKELMEYLSKSDPGAILFVETGTHVLELKNIIEDRVGIFLTSSRR